MKEKRSFLSCTICLWLISICSQRKVDGFHTFENNSLIRSVAWFLFTCLSCCVSQVSALGNFEFWIVGDKSSKPRNQFYAKYLTSPRPAFDNADLFFLVVVAQWVTNTVHLLTWPDLVRPMTQTITPGLQLSVNAQLMLRFCGRNSNTLFR